ncbi:MAG: carboxypeptidase regulatory-like domain-containing protein [Acidobacteriia bacterium]|nr:carboxypeptidase regulatory-like domain-containing protein [Terriglobia bacterium]
MSLSKRCSILFFVAMLAASAVPAAAQYTVGRIEGTVSDRTGAVLRGATVTLRHLETNATRSFTTGPTGLYVFFALPPGRYELRAEAPRFAPTVVSATVVTSQTVTQDLVLEVGAAPATTVEVVGGVSELDVADAQRSTTRSAAEIANLPGLGHNMMSLVHLGAGLAPTNNPRGGSTFGGGGSYVIVLGVQSGLIAANGGRARASSVQLDYTDANDWEGGGFAPGMQAISPDMLQEFKLLTSNFSAEYGVKSNAQVMMVTRSGSNSLHGTAYDFLQNDALNARDYFDTTGKATPVKQNIWGFTLGGPLRRDKTFFFGGYEGRKTRGNAITSVSTLPSDAARATVSDPVVKDLIDTYLPEPTEPIVGQPMLGRYVTQIPSPMDTYQFVFKADQRFSDAHSISARYLQSTAAFVARFPSQNALPGFDVDNHFALRNVNLTDTYVFSPKTVNELRFSYGNAAAAGLPQNGLETPRFLIVGVVNFGSLQSVPATRSFNVYQVNDLFSHVHGAHVLKFGGDLRFIYDNSVNATNARGVFTFPNLNAFLTGKPSSWKQLFGDTERNFHTAVHGFFFQDDWKVASTFTVNLGVRWEIQAAQTEADGKSSVLDPGTPGSIGAAGSGPLGTFRTSGPAIAANPFNLAPRIGFAWNPGHGNFVIRGGYGIYWDSFTFGPLAAARSAPPFNYTLSCPPCVIGGANSFANLIDGTAPIQAQGNAQVGSFGALLNFGQVTTVDPNLANPYVQNFSLGVERRLGKDYVVSLGYVGTKANHLTRLIPINSKIGGARLDPRFDQVDTHDDGGGSIYHSLQAEVRKNFSHGLQLQASYTWSKSIDDASDFAPTIQANDNSYIQDASNPQAERAVSNFDIPHRIVVTAIWNLPFFRSQKGVLGKAFGGWSFQSVNMWQSALPATIMSGAVAGVVDVNQDGNLIPTGLDNTRANCNPAGFGFVLGDPTGIYGYTQPALGSNGSCERNSARMRSLTNFDWAFAKSFRLSESGPAGAGPWDLQFRAELVNIFNTPFLTAQGDAWRTVASPTFGQINAAGIPRKAQVALKLQW